MKTLQKNQDLLTGRCNLLIQNGPALGPHALSERRRWRWIALSMFPGRRDLVISPYRCCRACERMRRVLGGELPTREPLERRPSQEST